MKIRSLTERWYRAPVATGLADDGQVDHQAGIIRGVVQMEEGMARGHNEEVDETTLRTLVALENGSSLGARARFGHPSMSDDALPKFAGRQNKFRMDRKDGTNRVIGDLTFDPSAMADPAKLAQRTMLRAENDSASFGVSVVIKRDLEFRFEEDGKTRLKDTDGDDLPPLIRPLELMAADLVDSPAATTALFSETDFAGTTVQLSAGVTEALDDLLDRSDAEDRVAQFFDKFALSRPEAVQLIRDAIERHDHRPSEVEMKDPTKEPEHTDDQTLLSRIRGVLGMDSKQPGGKPHPEPALADGTNPALSEPTVPLILGDSATEPEISELRAEITSMRAQIETDRVAVKAERLAAATVAFDARVNAQLAMGKLTASGAENLIARGKQLILAGGNAEEIIEPFESGPAPDDLADLRGQVTFDVPWPGHDDIPVDMLSFGATQNTDGTFAPVVTREEAAKITLGLGGKRGKDAVEELKRQVMAGEGY